MVAPERVIILERCVLNNPNHRSLGWLEVGDIVEIAGGAYAESVIESGLAALVTEGVPQESLDDLDALDAQIAAAEHEAKPVTNPQPKSKVQPKPQPRKQGRNAR